jgi:pimeloyl-ACP methyl ester carboxylesterase
VHGYPSTSRLWDVQVEGLAGAAHVVRVDIEGTDRFQGLVTMTTELLAALKARSPLRQTLVVAHDIGCFVANEVALARAELVDRQVLINGAGIALARAVVAVLLRRAARAAARSVARAPLGSLDARRGLRRRPRARRLRAPSGRHDEPGAHRPLS